MMAQQEHVESSQEHVEDSQEHVEASQEHVEASQEHVEASQPIKQFIQDYFSNNAQSILLLPQDDTIEAFVEQQLNNQEHITLESSSEDLFQYISTEKTVPYVIIQDFAPSSLSTKENTKIINIIRQLLNYGQSIICFTDKVNEFYDNYHNIINIIKWDK